MNNFTPSASTIFDRLDAAAATERLVDSLGLPEEHTDRAYGMRIGRSATRMADDDLPEGRELTDEQVARLRAQLERMTVRSNISTCPTLSIADAAAVLNYSEAEVLSLMEDRMLCKTFVNGELRVRISLLAGHLTRDVRFMNLATR